MLSTWIFIEGEGVGKKEKKGKKKNNQNNISKMTDWKTGFIKLFSWVYKIVKLNLIYSYVILHKNQLYWKTIEEY